MKELLFSVTKKDLRIDYFSGTGAGGQYRNKHQNCIRIFHKDSGAISTGQSNRERKSNLREALNNLIKHPKFKIWQAMMVNQKISGKSIEEIVEEQVKPQNLKIEKFKNNKWEEFKNE